MPKGMMHSFWILPKGYNTMADRILDERITRWGIVPISRGGPAEEAEELSRYLLDFSAAKAYTATHINNRMMLESFQAFLTIKTLTEGFLPAWGFCQNSFSVVPAEALPELISVLGTLSPYAAWKRLQKLCIEAQIQGNHLLYRGILPEYAEDYLTARQKEINR